MDIQFTGINIDPTAQLKEYTIKRFETIKRHAPNIISTTVTFKVDKLRHHIHAEINIPNKKVVATAESESMYNSIDAIVPKLDRQLQKLKPKY